MWSFLVRVESVSTPSTFIVFFVIIIFPVITTSSRLFFKKITTSVLSSFTFRPEFLNHSHNLVRAFPTSMAACSLVFDEVIALESSAYTTILLVSNIRATNKLYYNNVVIVQSQTWYGKCYSVTGARTFKLPHINYCCKNYYDSDWLSPLSLSLTFKPGPFSLSL